MTIGYAEEVPAFPKTSLPRIKLDTARGERLIKIGGLSFSSLVLLFETGYALVRAGYDQDDDTPYIREPELGYHSYGFDELEPLRKATLLTEEQVKEYLSAVLAIKRNQTKGQRYAQYLELKKEFEGK